MLPYLLFVEVLDAEQLSLTVHQREVHDVAGL